MCRRSLSAATAWRKRLALSTEGKTEMQIGSKVIASSDFSEIQGVIIGGDDMEFGDYATTEGRDIDMDGVVVIRSSDDNKPYRCNGWLWSFEAA